MNSTSPPPTPLGEIDGTHNNQRNIINNNQQSWKEKSIVTENNWLICWHVAMSLSLT